MGKIRIKNMQFYTYNGALPEERVLGQKIEIDATLKLSLTAAGQSDDLNQTVSYAEVYEVIKAYVESHSFDLIEALTYGVLDELETHFSEKVKSVKLQVRKYHVPIPGIFDHIEIEMKRDFHS